MHAIVLERESIRKGFPYLLVAQKLGRAVDVKNIAGHGDFGPQRDKTLIDSVFKEVAFIFVHYHP